MMQYVAAENLNVRVVGFQPGEVWETDLGDDAPADGDILIFL